MTPDEIDRAIDALPDHDHSKLGTAAMRHWSFRLQTYALPLIVFLLYFALCFATVRVIRRFWPGSITAAAIGVLGSIAVLWLALRAVLSSRVTEWRIRRAMRRQYTSDKGAGEVAMQQHVRRVYDLLVGAQYAEIERLTGGVRLSAADIKVAVSSYPHALRPWPRDQQMPLDVIEVRNAERRTWSVRVPAFTREEGRSDLSLELTLVAAGRHRFKVEFDNLHVL